MKTLKFTSNPVPKILAGEKTSTRRLFDDKHLTKGDILVLLEKDKTGPFAKAKITKIAEKNISELVDEEKGSHGSQTLEEMCRHYEHLYNKAVTPETAVKVIYFELC